MRSDNEERKQPELFGGPITAVYVIAPDLGFQAVAMWSETYKAYLIETRTPWTAEGAPTWTYPSP